MSRPKLYIIIASVVVSLLLVGGAVLIGKKRQEAARTPAPAVQGREERTVTKSEFTAATGKDGKACYVAVDGIVYEIKDFSMWQNGQHDPSAGEAYCGADMSAVIEKAPHGKKILEILIKIGPLKA